MQASLRAHRITSGASPLADQIRTILHQIPDDDLISGLTTYHAGRRGYGLRTLWRTYVAGAYLGTPSFAALIRALEDNPALRAACGIRSPDGIPSKYAYSRFLRKFTAYRNVKRVRDILRAMTRQLYETFPDFGKVVSIDSTDMKAWSNPNHREKADPEAGWVVKQGTNGKKKYVYGWKLHVLANSRWELPIAAKLTAGNVSDVTQASALLREARRTSTRFNPASVAADAGYSSKDLRHVIRRQYKALPVVMPNKGHRKAVAATVQTPEWKRAYRMRTGIERLFGRLKSHRRLDSVTVRGRYKVTVHSLLPMIVAQAWALAVPESPRQLVRAA